MKKTFAILLFIYAVVISMAFATQNRDAHQAHPCKKCVSV